MLFTKAASALAFAAGALANCSGNVQATGQGDLDNINGCSTYTGTITITGDDLTTGTLSGVQNLKGDLVFNNVTQLSSFSAPALQSISGSFQVQVATVLSTFSFPQLGSVGSINWVTLPALSGLQFDNSVTNASDVIISDTGLTSLSGINVNKVGQFNLNNNRYLNEVDVDLYTVSDSLDVSYNSASLSASFPHLIWANNMTFRDCQSISFPKLANVNESLGFINNSVMGLDAPALKTVGGSFSVVSNSQLTNLSFANLQSIGGGFVIANNTKLTNILGFPDVKSVGGAIQFIGNFSSAALDSLTLVKGGVQVISSSDKFNCSSFNSAHSNGDFQGDSYECKAKSVSTSVALSHSPTQSSGSASTGGSSDATATSTSSSSSKSKNGGNKIEIGTTLMGAFAAFLFQFV